jgi:hypothetical protein
VVEIDFYWDAPALRNEFKVWFTPGFLEGPSVADAPGWFRTHAEMKTLERKLREEYEKVTSDSFLVLYRASNSMVSVSHLDYELVSDGVVVSIGSED